MTSEEIAVIQAAIHLRYCIDAETAGDPPRIGRLLDAVDALISRDDWLNAGTVSCLLCRGQGCDQCHQVGMWREPDEPIRLKLRGSIKPKATWLPATFVDCMAGDRIRIGQDETTVTWTDGGQEWHVGGDLRYAPVRWDHVELRMDLEANPGRQQYPPATPCEILCTPERAVVLEFQLQFPGSKPVDV